MCRMKYPHDFPDFPCGKCSPKEYAIWYDREERKAKWISKATAHFDTPEIRREALEMFDKANPL